MRKILALVLLVLLILPGCSRLEKQTVAVFWYEEADVYLSSVRTELDAAFEERNIRYTHFFAENDQQKQLEQINAAIADGVSLLVVNQVRSGDSDIAHKIINAAGKRPVVFFNRAIGTEGTDVTLLSANKTTCFIGTNAPEAGHLQGRMIGNFVLEHFERLDLNGDGKISYAMLKGEESNAEAIFRTRYSVTGADKILTAAGKAALVYFDPYATQMWQTDPTGAWSAKAAQDWMNQNLTEYNLKKGNMIELVICNNDEMALGAVKALQAVGLNREGAPHIIPVFGVDATAKARSLIAQGWMTGTVKQDAGGMAGAIAGTVQAVLNGSAPVDALKNLGDRRFRVAVDCDAKLYVEYAAYTGE